MERFTLEELYRGSKYNIMGRVARDLFEYGLKGEELQIRIELLMVRETCLSCIHLLTAEKMKQEGDCVSGLTEIQPPFCTEVKQ